MSTRPDREALVEKMARAISPEGMPLGYFSDNSPMRAAQWDDFLESSKEEHRDQARRALAAIEATGVFRALARTPTDTMIDAMLLWWPPQNLTAKEQRAQVKTMFRAAFDAAPLYGSGE